MNLSKFKDPVSNVCLAVAAVALCYLTQDPSIMLSNTRHGTIMTNTFVSEFLEFPEFSENIQEKLKCVFYFESWQRSKVFLAPQNTLSRSLAISVNVLVGLFCEKVSSARHQADAVRDRCV